MMRAFDSRGRSGTVRYRLGPFVVALDSDYAPLLDLLHSFYSPLALGASEEIASFHIQMRRNGGWPRRWVRPQIRFLLDGPSPFEPYPLDHAFPLFEWGLNWCIAMRAHQYLMLHAAVLERGGAALLLPAVPGSGKSTLSAALMLRGWRLLCDEFGLCNPLSGQMLAMPRAVPLKNESIAAIRAFSEQARLGPIFPRTRKGDVAHLRPPADSLLRQHEPAWPTRIVFPRFAAQAPFELRKLPQSEGFVRLAHNAFNYQFLGGEAFVTLTRLVSRCSCHSLIFASLDDAVAALDALCPT